MKQSSWRAGGVNPLFESQANTENRGLTPPARLLVWGFIALAVLLTPLFAHGCHGDDIDHEPLFIPVRLNSHEP